MKKRFLFIILSFALVFTGCSNISETSNKPSSETSSKESSKVSSERVHVYPLTENKSGKVQIQTVSTSDYAFNSYIIISSKGETVVVDPTYMPPKNIVNINPAAIVSTHGHPDHVDSTFNDSYDCQKILYKKTDIKTKDFHIYTIPSSHKGDAISDESGNMIAVFEVDGIRIAHMGDIGQTKITASQLKALGKIDIAFMQFENSYSDMTLENEKGFKLIEQVNPKIIIPTHYNDPPAFSVIEKKYGKITQVENVLQISKEDLPQKPLSFYHITNTHSYY